MSEIKIKYEFPEYVEHQYIFNFQWEIRNFLEAYRAAHDLKFEIEGLNLD